MTGTWARTPAPRTDEAEQAIAARLMEHGTVARNTMITGYVIAAQTANFDHDGDVVESCAWIPSLGLSLDAQIGLLEVTLEQLRQERAQR